MVALFLSGVFVGGVLGILLMAFIQVNKNEEED